MEMPILQPKNGRLHLETGEMDDIRFGSGDSTLIMIPSVDDGPKTLKCKTAREVFAESFRELASKKPVDKITVPDIVGNGGYSKTTFYRLFKDKYGLMAWDYTTRHQEIMVQTEIRKLKK